MSGGHNMNAPRTPPRLLERGWHLPARFPQRYFSALRRTLTQAQPHTLHRLHHRHRLSCALITAIFTSVVTLYGGLLKAEIVTDGTWQVELVNVPEDELDTVHADTRVEESYDRISYGDASCPRALRGTGAAT
mgnify:CR=1 FL=1